MTTRKSISPACFFLITLLSVSITGSAQTPLSVAKREPVLAPEIFTPASSLSQPASQTNLKSSDRALADNDFGSLTGRVLFDKIPGLGLRNADPIAVGGVKVMFRRVDGGMGAIAFDRLSRPDGNYDFQFVRPGRYSLEVDRAEVSVDRRIVFFDVSASRPNHVDLFVEPLRGRLMRPYNPTVPTCKSITRRHRLLGKRIRKCSRAVQSFKAFQR